MHIKTTKKFKTIYVDPPWPGQSGEKHYRTMSLADIRALPLADLADEEGCHLWYWCTNKYLREALENIEAAGFTVGSPLTWIKFRLGLGGQFTLRNATEHCIFATRGKLPVQFRSQPTWINAPVTEHSAKPFEMYAAIERVSPGPRLELFARRQHPGWDVWGDEVVSTIPPIPGYPVPSDFTNDEETDR